MDERYQPSVDESAWLYAKVGWPVCPLHDLVAGHCSCSDGPLCRVAGKHPRLRLGFHGATTDTRKVEQWWTRWPQANIAVVTGGPRGLVAVDLDGEAGSTSWERLTAEHGRGPATATALTPHGRHLWYRLPCGLSVPRRIGSVAAHVDILGDGGYGIVPPSVVGREHPDRHEGQCSGRYQWTTRRARIAELPAWIAELANRRDHTREGMQGGTPEQYALGCARRKAGSTGRSPYKVKPHASPPPQSAPATTP
jgi:hypothetical protein